MKSKKTFKYCEYCGKAWEDVSPPADEEYESGLIEINTGVDGPIATMLLPEKSRSDSSSCAIWFNGVFCSVDCLYKFLKEKLDGKKKK